MRNSFILVVAIIGLVSGAQVTTEGKTEGKTERVLPANFDVQDMLSREVTDLYGQSATFRAQCDRLANAQNLRVSMELDVAIPHSCRAFTVITRTPSALCADVHVPPTAQLAELIGHEFEHILEQLDHLNLRKLSQVRGSGVREVGFEIFETERAQTAGRVVAEELRVSRLGRSAAN
jgi:hypothetical protein